MAKQIMDGCTAATHIAYALSDVATIYPITPVASMGETAQKWGLEGRKNYAGATLQVEEMESELGAAGATHGALAAGSLATTFTNSQGLMLMLPNMYKIAGNMEPAVFHVGTRSLATHALSIFGDHSDIMATRATGFAFLGSCSVQGTMDLALVAHLAAVEGSLPVCHFFDGWRTSNQMASIDVIDYEKIWPLVNSDAIARFRAKALNPDHPSLRGSAQNSDVFFQNAEAANTAYNNFPGIVQDKMDAVAKITGRQYRLFDYSGAPDAETVLVAMGSACEVISQTVDYLNTLGYKAGVVTVHLFRPFSGKDLMSAIPSTAKTVVAMDRTKENGADGEPLFKDVATAAITSGRGNLNILGCRYGLASKAFDPAMVKGVIDEARSENPRRCFTVGINDDVTNLSIGYDPDFRLPVGTMYQTVIYGFGSDGMVGATKQAADILGNNTNLYAQAYFSYSAKKSGGYTVSELRVDKKPVKALYGIEEADFVICSKPRYVTRFKLASKLKHGGIFLLNCNWNEAELAGKLPSGLRKELAEKKARFFTINAGAVAAQNNLGVRVNMIMETAFFHLSGIMPFATAVSCLRNEISKTYMHEGGEVVKNNLNAVDQTVAAIHEISIPAEWLSENVENAETENDFTQTLALASSETFFKNISRRCLDLEGNSLPVSAFTPDGRMPMGTTAYERRGIAINVPQWDVDKCVECTECSLVCAHAAIRPFLLDSAEKTGAPAGFTSKPADCNKDLQKFDYRIQVYAMDCTGCGSCATICPGHALTMVPLATQADSQAPFESYVREKVSLKTDLLPRFTINGSQFQQPLLEFSGACAGCGETPYVKLLTQLFGERMLIANATGCSSIWGANYPSNAYCARKSDGRGPAWGNSLFEDNAEYGYGMAVAVRTRREALAAEVAASFSSEPENVSTAMQSWLENFNESDESFVSGKRLLHEISLVPVNLQTETERKVLANADILGKKSVWAIGGDGWAYDIGFAGLDHVMASGENINILVMDTECYSNTGGQTSKATPLGAVTKYSPAGKRVFKKDLGRMMMTYGTVYVASIALGANYRQTIDALREAEAYPGPSIVIAYCPCINHGIRAGMGDSIVEERKAVEAGYWPIYRYNPLLAESKLSPFIRDSVSAYRDGIADGLPLNGTPSAVEDSDKNTAGEGSWITVNRESSTLTVDYPPNAPQKQAADKSVPTPNDATQLFPTDRLNAFLNGEDRYADILLAAPQAAPALRSELSKRTQLLHTLLESLTNIL